MEQTTFCYQITKEDWVEAYPAFLPKQSKAAKLLPLGIALTVLLVSFFSSVTYPLDVSQLFFVLILPGLVVVLLAWLINRRMGSAAFLPRPFRRLAYYENRKPLETTGFIGPHTLSFTDRGLAVRYGTAEILLDYNSPVELKPYRGGFVLFREKSLVEIIPTSGLAGRPTHAQLLSLMNRCFGNPPPVSSAPTPLQDDPGDGLMTLRYRWEAPQITQALVEGNLLFRKTKLFWNLPILLFIALGLLLVAGGIYQFSHSSGSFSPFLNGFALLFIGVAGLLPLWMSIPPLLRLQVRKQVEGHLSLVGDHTLILYPDRLQLRSPQASDSYPLCRIYRVERLPHGLCVLFDNRMLLCIPYEAFAAPQQMEQFAALLQQQTPKKESH